MIIKLDGWWFKGLREISLEPQKLNLLIGANGTGKTNFADFIEFLSLTFRFGLKEALDKLGGLEDVRTNLPTGRPPSLGCKIALGPDKDRGIEEVSYKFTLATSKSLTVDTEELYARVHTPLIRMPKGVRFLGTELTEIKFKRKRDKIEYWTVPGLGASPTNFEDEENLILNAYGRIGGLRRIAQYLGAMRVYNIDATLAKNTSVGAETELERTGANLFFFLKRVLEDKDLKEKMLTSLRSVVPYIKEIETKRIFTYTTLIFSELDSKMEFRAQQMSDGTIRLLGLLAVLFHPASFPVVVIEEPENALHSYAIKTLLKIAQEASTKDSNPTQIFLTSHSPMVVDAILGLDNEGETSTRCFVTRREAGTSTIAPVPPQVMRAIAKNLGRPSDFLREGVFEDGPTQLEIDYVKEEKK